MSKILIVEDDNFTATVIETWLKFQRYKVDCAHTGAEARDFLSTYQYDIIVLDLGLPDADGVEICKQYRANGGTTPILMLTGRDRIHEKEIGLDGGADDYLTKPFDVKELAARIRALLRRPPVAAQALLKAGDIELDPATCEVKKAGQPIKLFPQEYTLLEFLLRHPNEVFSTDALIERAWRSESGVAAETVRSSVRRLRQQIDSEGENSLIQNLRGVGYILRVKNEQA